MRINRLLGILLVFVSCVYVIADVIAEENSNMNDVNSINNNNPPQVILRDIEELEGEKFTFQTEVSRLMHLIINSLYKSREIFLRELISNASDALDKIRFLSLTDPAALESNSDLKITIAAYDDQKTLVITDTGIGMTRSQLKDNLGTIAKSGTSEFLSKLEQNKDALTQIGQFGVGFYSIFLVADKVTVASKSNDEDDQYVWISEAVNDFTIAKDPRGNTLGRGTEITLHLKPDAYRFLEEKNLKQLVDRYSQFITFPIMVWSSHEVTVEKDALDDDIIEELIDEEKNESIQEKKLIHQWDQVNTQKPIWMRDIKNVSDEEHIEFFKSITKSKDDPLAWIHSKGEGEVEFRSVLYVPSAMSENFLMNMQKDGNNHPIKLFVKRVFISDEMTLLPKWLSFLKGIVDADDIPLNVSRETLQKHRSLRVISRHLAKKALDMFTALSQSDLEKYKKFLAQYSILLKYGAIEDQPYRKKITSLLRFSTSYDTSAFSSSLDDYIDRAKAGQKSIYFMTGSSVNEIEQSPFIESLLARGYEILYFTDPIDEHFVEKIPGYNGKMFVNIAKGDLDLDAADVEKDSQLEAEFKPLADWLMDILSDQIAKVVVSRRLTTSPLAIVSPKNGLSGHAQKLLDAQGVNHKNPSMNMILESIRLQKKNLEINPNHPVIRSLLDYVEQDDITEDMAELIKLMYETTSIRSGFPVKDMTQFANRVEGLIRKNVGVSMAEQAKVNVTPAKEKTEEEKKADEELKKTNIVYEDENDHEHDEL
ncbi:Hsp90 protein-domain-containing protein [Pilobolus umbonatus]|nr:Hsp90 protein-domain-containing protein [Pilobolus umbonatus]